MRVGPLLTGGLGQEVPLPLGLPPPVSAHLLGYQFVTFCENLKMTGRIFVELYPFSLRHFLTVFRPKVLNDWKFVKNRVLKQIANKNHHKTHNYLLNKLLSRIFILFGISILKKSNFIFRKIIVKFEIGFFFQTTGVYIRWIGENYTHSKVQKDMSILVFLKHYIAKKV